MGDVTHLPVPRTEPGRIDQERAGHVLALRKIDAEYANQLLQQLQAIESLCQVIVSTTLTYRTLPVGVVEEARQIAVDASDRMHRIGKLLNPMGGV